MGQFVGGRRTYFSFGGSVDWMKACLKSQDLGVMPFLTASATSKRSSICDKTGANVSVLSQSCGSKFPKAQIRYLALIGFPFLSCLMVEIVIDGNVGPKQIADVGILFR